MVSIKVPQELMARLRSAAAEEKQKGDTENTETRMNTTSTYTTSVNVEEIDLTLRRNKLLLNTKHGGVEVMLPFAGDIRGAKAELTEDAATGPKGYQQGTLRIQIPILSVSKHLEALVNEAPHAKGTLSFASEAF